jgi:hypothetical protein
MRTLSMTKRVARAECIMTAVMRQTAARARERLTTASVAMILYCSHDRTA